MMTMLLRAAAPPCIKTLLRLHELSDARNQKGSTLFNKLDQQSRICSVFSFIDLFRKWGRKLKRGLKSEAEKSVRGVMKETSKAHLHVYSSCFDLLVPVWSYREQTAA